MYHGCLASTVLWDSCRSLLHLYVSGAEVLQEARRLSAFSTVSICRLMPFHINLNTNLGLSSSSLPSIYASHTILQYLFPPILNIWRNHLSCSLLLFHSNERRDFSDFYECWSSCVIFYFPEECNLHNL